MGDSHLLHALRRRYAHTLGRIAAGELLADDLAHLGAVIRMFSPDADLSAIAPVRPYRSHKPGPRSAWVRAAIETLRTANGPLSAHEVAVLVIAAIGLAHSPQLVRNVRTAVRIALKRREGGAVCAVEGEPRRWVLNRL